MCVGTWAGRATDASPTTPDTSRARSTSTSTRICERRRARAAIPCPTPRCSRPGSASSGSAPSTRWWCYDDVGGGIAARLWWMLDDLGHGSVSVLDGGFLAWVEGGHPVEIAAPSWPAATLRPPRPVGRASRTATSCRPGSARSCCWTPAAPPGTAARWSRSTRSPGTSRPPGTPRPTATSGPMDGSSSGDDLRARFEALGATGDDGRRRDVVRQWGHGLPQRAGDADRRTPRPDPVSRFVERLVHSRLPGRHGRGAGGRAGSLAARGSTEPEISPG